MLTFLLGCTAHNLSLQEESSLNSAAGKQGSDGPEALMYNDEACLTPLCKGEVSGLEEESSETQIQSEQEEFLSTMRGEYYPSWILLNRIPFRESGGPFPF